MPSKYRKADSTYRNRPHSGTKSKPTGTDAELNLASLSALFTDENKARHSWKPSGGQTASPTARIAAKRATP